MAMGAPIDAESSLRALLDVLISKGTVNQFEADQILQIGEAAEAKKPAYKKFPEFAPPVAENPPTQE